MSKNLRSGITTGTCAAAAAQAAVLRWIRKETDMAMVTNPKGLVLHVPIHESRLTACGAMASVIKDAGDDPDITNGTLVCAHILLHQDLAGVMIKGGKGVGRVTKPGLQVPVGDAAINPVPRKMIEDAVKKVLPEGWGVEVVIEIPKGEELAKRTLNPHLGIVGGLSVLGTTGIVEPMSEEAFRNSLTGQLKISKALGFRQIVFVPGKIGQDVAVCKYGLPENAVIQTSNFIGFMLEEAVKEGFEKILLLGHLGKIIKVAGGIFHTHNRMGDGRMETLAAYMAAEGASTSEVKNILQCTTTEAAMEIVKASGICYIYNILAAKATERAERYVYGDLQIGTVIVNMQGELLGMDAKGKYIGDMLGWSM